jgi:hypothetical protein
MVMLPMWRRASDTKRLLESFSSQGKIRRGTMLGLCIGSQKSGHVRLGHARLGHEGLPDLHRCNNLAVPKAAPETTSATVLLLSTAYHPLPCLYGHHALGFRRVLTLYSAIVAVTHFCNDRGMHIDDTWLCGFRTVSRNSWSLLLDITIVYDS